VSASPSAFNHDLWISANGGNSFRKSTLPFQLDGSLVFHPHVAFMSRILALDTMTLVRYILLSA
jgi:hypothetical protein